MTYGPSDRHQHLPHCLNTPTHTEGPHTHRNRKRHRPWKGESEMTFQSEASPDCLPAHLLSLPLVTLVDTPLFSARPSPRLPTRNPPVAQARRTLTWWKRWQRISKSSLPTNGSPSATFATEPTLLDPALSPPRPSLSRPTSEPHTKPYPDSRTDPGAHEVPFPAACALPHGYAHLHVISYGSADHGAHIVADQDTDLAAKPSAVALPEPRAFPEAHGVPLPSSHPGACQRTYLEAFATA